MFYWSSFPFIRLLIPFLIGVYLYGILPEIETPHFLLGSFFILFVMAIIYHRRTKSYHQRWVAGFLFSCCLIVFGVYYNQLHQENFEPPAIQLTKQYSWIGKVSEMSTQGKLIKSVVVEVKQLKDSTWRATNFKLLIYNRDSSLNVSHGDYLKGYGYLKNTQAPQNPAQFNYQQFLAHKNIYFTSYQPTMVKKRGGFSIHKLAQIARQKIVNTYEKIGIENDELAVLVALTLGDKSQLSFEQKEDFAGAGAMHVLAVSGLHVGIIFLLFQSVLKVLPDRKYYHHFKGIILLVVVWLFAFLAGLSPSVQRAGWMFSFVIISKVYNKESSILNSIAVSAFILILLNPMVIHQIGFVLSYSAVIGIILIHPIIYNWLNPQNIILDKVWSLLVVSMAAQIATLPFTLYYFHQFPFYFLLTNLMVIPLAFVIVAGGILCATIHLLVGMDFYLGEILNVILVLFNGSVSLINQFPSAIIDGIWISKLSFTLLIGGIWMIVLYLHSLRVKHLVYGLLIFIGLIIIELAFDLQQLRRSQITVYSFKNPSLSYVKGFNAMVYQSKDAQDYDLKVIKDHLESLGVKEIITLTFDSSTQFIQLHNKVFAMNLSKKLVVKKGSLFIYNILTDKTMPIKTPHVFLIDNNYQDLKNTTTHYSKENYHNLKHNGAFTLKWTQE